MICNNCKANIDDDVKFCPYCGSEVIIEAEVISQDPVQEKRNAKCWHVFANVGYVLSIITIATCWFGFGFIVGIYGIIFSALGKVAKPVEEKASKGLTLSIVGTAIGFTIFITAYIVLVILIASQAIATHQ